MDEIPDITEFELQDYAAQALSEAAGMYRAAKEQANNFQEAVDILTASMVECFARGRRILNEYDPDLLPTDRHIIAQNMNVCICTISAASLALRALYHAVEQSTLREKIQQN